MASFGEAARDRLRAMYWTSKVSDKVTRLAGQLTKGGSKLNVQRPMSSRTLQTSVSSIVIATKLRGRSGGCEKDILHSPSRKTFSTPQESRAKITDRASMLHAHATAKGHLENGETKEQNQR